MGETRGASSAARRRPLHGSEQRLVAGSTLKRSRGTTREGGRGPSRPVPDFSSEEERYDWEIEQRFSSMDTLDRWFASDGIYTIGPPIPPHATVYSDEKATEAFKKATKAGYYACRPAGEQLGVSRKSVRKLIDRFRELRVAYVTYPGKISGTRYHCRVIHRDSIRIVNKNVRLWMKRISQGGKKTTAENIRRGS